MDWMGHQEYIMGVKQRSEMHSHLWNENFDSELIIIVKLADTLGPKKLIIEVSLL